MPGASWLQGMRDMACLVMAGALLGCAAKARVAPAQICLYGSSSRLLDVPPQNATTLFESVAKRPGLVDAPKNSRDYWFESSSGSLRLCRQKADAHDVCGSANVEFKLVDGSWRAQSGVDVPVCSG